MRDKISEIVCGVFNPDLYKTKIHWGYDCIGIEFEDCLNDNELSLMDIEELKRALCSELCWIRINDEGNMVLCYDIRDMILSKFEYWENYEKAYGLEEV